MSSNQLSFSSLELKPSKHQNFQTVNYIFAQEQMQSKTLALIPIDLKMELFVMLCKVSILKEFSVQSVLHVLQVKQSSFGHVSEFYVRGFVI